MPTASSLAALNSSDETARCLWLSTGRNALCYRVSDRHVRGGGGRLVNAHRKTFDVVGDSSTDESQPDAQCHVDGSIQLKLYRPA
jgi:hypothetical protein